MEGYEDLLEDFELKVERIFSSQGDEDTLLEEILAIILLLFLLGSGYEEESELTPQDRKWLDDMYKMSVASVPGMVERNQNDTDMAATLVRLRNHVLGAYHYSFMALGTDAGEMYRWMLGDADHCGDCMGYSNLGPKEGAFWQRVATERNHYPQSQHLECKGLHCQCSFQAVSDRETEG